MKAGGGCGASILGDNPEDCINRWNTRFSFDKDDIELHNG